MRLQAPIPGVVLSYRLSQSLRGWHPGHRELAGSTPDLTSSQHDEQRQQQQQPDSEYGAIAKFAGKMSKTVGKIKNHRLGQYGAEPIILRRHFGNFVH